MSQDSELKFIAGVFFDYEISKDQEYLFKYINTKLGKQFVRYYLCFGNCKMFVDHTGFFCSRRWQRKLKARIKILQNAYDEAKEKRDSAKLAEIKMGKYDVGNNK